MIRSLYRYRSVESLLGEHQELEAQQIYFASAEELNDPMEGYQDVVWKGDYVLWKNLFRHYILCLTQAVYITGAMGQDFEPSLVLPIFHWSASHLPTDISKSHHRQVCSDFFSRDGIEECLHLLDELERPVRREELVFYLLNIHPAAFDSIMSLLRKEGLVPRVESLVPDDLPTRTIQNFLNMLIAIKKSPTAEKAVMSQLFGLGNMTIQQVALIRVAKEEVMNKALRFLAFEFTELYCRNIPYMLYPKWYAACFVGKPENAAMWAHYGDKHRGLCLKFRTEVADGIPFLKLSGVVGASQSTSGRTPVRRETKMNVQKVNYSNSFPEIDFFRSFGRLSSAVIHSDWYSDETRHSEAIKAVFGNEATWIKKYWENLMAVATTKFSDWSSEEEYRIVLNPLSEYEIEKSERVFNYDFNDLEGIIFGPNTSMDDKIKIMKIVDRKCTQHSRKEFEFMQAHYSGGTNKFNIEPLPLIKFE